MDRRDVRLAACVRISSTLAEKLPLSSRAGDISSTRGVPQGSVGESEMRENFGERNFVHDKDEAAAAIVPGPVLRPGVEPFRREHRMLCGLHHRRPFRAIRKQHDALDPQQIVAAGPGEPTERAGEIETGDRTAETDGKAVDAMSMDGNRLTGRERRRGMTPGGEQ